jgi:hypothetical protein
VANRSTPWIGAGLVLAGLAGGARAQGPGPWADSFEAYAVGSTMPGQGGWEEWDMQVHADPGRCVSTPVAAQHGTQYMMVRNDGDTIRRFTGYTSGRYTFKGWMYLPSTLGRPAYWLVLNTYNHFGPYNWSVQIRFNEPAFPGGWCIDAGSPCTASGTYPPDQWFEIRCEVDLAADTTEVYLDGVLMAPAYSWQNGVFGAGGGALVIACVDAYAGGTSAPTDESYFENFNLSSSPGCTGNVTLYCTAKVNSAGCTPSIHAVGFPAVGTPAGFDISATELLDNKFGLLFYGKSGPFSFPFQGGTLCVMPPQSRTDTQSSGGGANPPCDGFMSVDFNAYVATGADPGLVAGQTVWAQYWSRDPGFAPPDNTNLTDAVEFTLCSGPPSFAQMSWSNLVVPLNNGGSFVHSATLNGTINVAPSGAQSGSAMVQFDDGSTASLSQSPSAGTSIQSGTSVLELVNPKIEPHKDYATLNGAPVSLLAIATGLEGSIAAGTAPLSMPDEERALLALGALAATSSWQQNVAVGQTSPASAGYWCKVAVTGALSQIALRETVICSTGCSSGGTIAVGGFELPCSKLCIAGSFAGMAATQSLLEGVWNP